MISLDISSIIRGRLYLGNKAAAKDLDMLTKLGITHILNATKEIECHHPKAFTYLQISIRDGDEHLSDHLEKAIQFIKEGKKVFVHCAKGASRSASMVIAYLMRTKNWSYGRGFNLVKKKRPVIKPHFNFKQTLSNFNSRRNRLRNKT